MTRDQTIGVLLLCALTACGYPSLAPLGDHHDGGAIDTTSDTAIGTAIDAAMIDASDVDATAIDAGVDATAIDARVDATAADAPVDSSTPRPRRMMLVLIDATGSMASARSDSTTRFQAAQTMAKAHIRSEAASADGLAGAAVYSFSDSGLEAHTTGFIDPTTASNTIDGIVVGAGAAALAGSLCDSMDVLASAGGSDVTKLLELYSDGGENNTPVSNPCSGPPSNSDLPFDAGSWQNKVWTKATGGLRQHITTTLLGPGSLRAQRRSLTAPAALSDASFFSTLAQSTSGQFRQVLDDQPLPGSLARP